MRHPRLAAGIAAIAAASLLAACSSSGDKTSSTGKQSKGHLNFAYSNAVQQAEKVPLHLALQNLTKAGTTTKELFNQNAEDAIQEVARGQADFGTAATSSVFAAIKQGVPIKAIMTAYMPDYLVVAPSSVSDPSGLGGKRFGIQSKISSTTFYADLALTGHPDVKPKYLVVPGSANRVQAMIAGQMDGSVLQYGDWLTLEKKAPGKFHIIYNVTEQNPQIIDSVIFARTQSLQSDPTLAKTFLAAVQKEYATILGDPTALASALSTVVPGLTQDTATSLAPELIKDKIWPPDGGFSNASLQATLDALVRTGLLTSKTVPTTSECCTSSYLGPTPSGN